MSKILSLAEALKNLSEQGVTLDEAVQLPEDEWVNRGEGIESGEETPGPNYEPDPDLDVRGLPWSDVRFSE